MRVAGLDGCKGGWVAVIIAPGGAMTTERLGQLADLFDRPDAPDCVAVDMPIGLPERVGPGGRTPERLVRARLGTRKSSVFSMPSRAAVYATRDDTMPEDTRYRHGCSVARATSETQKAFSKQAFHIFPKIIDIDKMMRARPDIAARLHECHPEVSFWAMNGEQPLLHPKKIRHAPEQLGLDLRRRLLEAQGFGEAVPSAARARELKVGADDLVDACAAAWTARRITAGTAIGFPPDAERDGEGLPIQIQA